jgi:hypothetical protein
VVIAAAGVLIFADMTAWNTQRIKEKYDPMQDGTVTGRKGRNRSAETLSQLHKSIFVPPSPPRKSALRQAQGHHMMDRDHKAGSRLSTGRGKMSNLIVLGFEGKPTADEVLNKLCSMQKEYLIDLDESCVVGRELNVRPISSKRSISRPLGPAAGGSRGAFCCAVVGLLFLNPLAGMEVGAGRGRRRFGWLAEQTASMMSSSGDRARRYPKDRRRSCDRRKCKGGQAAGRNQTLQSARTEGRLIGKPRWRRLIQPAHCLI